VGSFLELGGAVGVGAVAVDQFVFVRGGRAVSPPRPGGGVDVAAARPVVDDSGDADDLLAAPAGHPIAGPVGQGRVVVDGLGEPVRLGVVAVVAVLGRAAARGLPRQPVPVALLGGLRQRGPGVVHDRVHQVGGGLPVRGVPLDADGGDRVADLLLDVNVG